MSQDVLSKIWYLCKNINNVEWSGIIFCKTEGHPIEPETFSVRALDILPMHKGEPTYTEFEIDDTIIDMFDYNVDLEESKLGIIHSHVNMDVFFSNTDSNTLHEYALISNYCISIIVNNRGEITGKVAYPVKSTNIIKDSSIKDNEGNWIVIDNDNYKNYQKDNILVKELSLIPIYEFESIFTNNVDKIIKEATNASLNNFGKIGYYSNDYSDWFGKSEYYNDSHLISNPKTTVNTPAKVDNVDDLDIEYFIESLLKLSNSFAYFSSKPKTKIEDAFINHYNSITNLYSYYSSLSYKFRSLLQEFTTKYLKSNNISTKDFKDNQVYSDLIVLFTINYLESIIDKYGSNSKIKDVASTILEVLQNYTYNQYNQQI